MTTLTQKTNITSKRRYEMIEILFRGKRIDNGEWVDGYLIIKNDKAFIIQNDSDYWHPVIPETVGQYIGDDKNGMKIFKGDIIAGPSTYTMLVVIKDGHPMVQFTDTDIGDTEPKLRMLEQGHIDEYGIEVIGSIHDNPELVVVDAE